MWVTFRTPTLNNYSMLKNFHIKFLEVFKTANQKLVLYFYMAFQQASKSLRPQVLYHLESCFDVLQDGKVNRLLFNSFEMTSLVIRSIYKKWLPLEVIEARAL